MREKIERLRGEPLQKRWPGQDRQRASADSMRQQLHVYREELARLRAESTALKEQLARQLRTARAASVIQISWTSATSVFVLRSNRRRSRSRGLVFYRIMEPAVGHEPVRYRDLVLARRPKRNPLAGRAGWGHPPSLGRPPADRPWRAA